MGSGEVRLVYCLSIDLIESTVPGLRMTQVELDRFNRALVAQIEPHLEALRFDDLLVKFTGDGWLLMTPEVRDAERLCALGAIMRDTFADEMRRRTGLPRARIPDLRMAICAGRDIRVQLWEGSFDWVGDSARRATRSASFCFPNEILVDGAVQSLVMRDFLTARIDPGTRPSRRMARLEEEIPLWSLEDLRIEAVEDWDAAAAYVYALGRLGRLDDAAEASTRAASRLVDVDELAQSPGSARTTQRWNRLIANAPTYESVLELVTRLLESPSRPDTGTLVALVDRAPTLEEARTWVADLRIHGVQPDGTVYSTLIRRAPTVEVGLGLLGEMEDEGVEVTTAMVNLVLAKALTFRGALGLLGLFGERGLNPDLDTFGRLVAKAPGYDAAVGLLDVMRTSGVGADSSIMNRIVSLAPDFETAVGWLDRMEEDAIPPDAATFSILIARAPRYGAALELLDSMGDRDVAPDVTTFNTLMARAPDHGLAVGLLRRMENANVPPTPETFKALIVRAPDYATAVGWLTEMGRRGVRPNNEVFKALIVAAPDYETAASWLGEMPTANVAPNAETFRTLIGRAPAFADGVSLVEDMRRRNVRPNEETFRTLASLAAGPDEREQLVTMLERHNVRPTADVLNSILARVEGFDDAERWMNRLVDLSVSPNGDTLTVLLRKTSDHGAAVDVWERFGSSVEPNEGAYRALVERAPDFSTARVWVERMRAEGMRPEVAILTILMQKDPGEIDADALLGWYLALDHHPSGPMKTAIETFVGAGRIRDALRLVLDYPHLDEAREVFADHPDESLAYFEEVLDEDPGHPNGRYAMGLALLQLGRNDEALRHLELARELARPGPRVVALDEIIRGARPGRAAT
jgi:tetratricopeptide (TPR) repeat protein